MSEKMSLDDYFKSGGEGNKPSKKLGKKKPRKNNKAKRAAREDNNDSKVAYQEESYPTVIKVQTWGRAIFWVVVGLLVIRGIFVLISPPRPVVNEIKYMQSLSESDMVKAFAEQFVREYLTYNSQNQGEYKSRLQKYTVSVIAANNIVGWSEVLETNVWKLYKLDDNNAVVTIHAKVIQGKQRDSVKPLDPSMTHTQTQSQAQQPTQPPQQTTAAAENPNKIEFADELYVKVPIRAISDNSFIVTDYPVFTTPFEPTTDYYNDETQNLETASDAVRSEIKTLMDNFFKIYDDGTPDQISYYMLDSQKMKGFEGKYIYNRILTYDVYKLNKSEDQVLVNVQIETNDKIGSSFNQKFRFLMKKQKADKELRWYIERFIDVGEKIENINK